MNKNIKKKLRCTQAIRAGANFVYNAVGSLLIFFEKLESNLLLV